MADRNLYDPRIKSGQGEGLTIGQREARAGTFTRLRAKQSFSVDGRMAVGGQSTPDVALLVTGEITGTDVQYGVKVSSVASEAAVTEFNQFTAAGSLNVDATYICAVARQFYAMNLAHGVNSAALLQVGFDAENMFGALTNFGFRGQLNTGTNTWNLYMSGTAHNYMAGSLLLGTTTDGMTADGSLAVAQDLAHRGDKVGFYNVAPVTKPAVTGNAANVASTVSIAAALATLGLVTDSTTNTAPTISGSRGGNAALASLLSALDTLGIISNGTSA